MATSTPNYGLKKFENGDPPDLPSLAASMDKIDTELKKNETNIGLLNKYTLITWASTDDIWHSKPSGLYAIGEAATSLGYPSQWSLIHHYVWGTVVFQQCQSSVMYMRRFDVGQSKGWQKLDGTAV